MGKSQVWLKPKGASPAFLGGAITYSKRLTDAPQFLNQHGFEECAGLLYAVGGETTVISSDGNYAYDPAANTWSSKAALPILVESPVLRAVAGKLYCIGGLVSALTPTADVYEYDPAGDAWTKKADMPTAREDMGSAVVGTKIYVFGGLTTNNTPTKKLEIYDTVANTWSSGADMPDYKHLGDFGCVVDGKIYAFGGTNTFANYPTLHPVTACYRYNPASNSWSTIASMPVGVCYFEAAVLDGIVYIVSGCTDSTTTFTNLIQSYDPLKNKWATETLLSPFAARGIGLCVYAGEIYMSGGCTAGSQKNTYKLSIGALGPELVPNGGFETGNPPTGWSGLYTPGTLSTVADARPGSSGSKSLDLVLTAAVNDVYIVVPWQTGKNYFLQIWCKNIDTTAINPNVLSSGFDSLLFLGDGAVGTWDNLQATFTGTTNNGYMLFYVGGAVGQHARIDDISIREIL